MERGDGVRGEEGMHCSYGAAVSHKVDNQQGQDYCFIVFCKKKKKKKKYIQTRVVEKQNTYRAA